jgi:hypothetical protein
MACLGGSARAPRGARGRADRRAGRQAACLHGRRGRASHRAARRASPPGVRARARPRSAGQAARGPSWPREAGGPRGRVVQAQPGASGAAALRHGGRRHADRDEVAARRSRGRGPRDSADLSDDRACRCGCVWPGRTPRPAHVKSLTPVPARRVTCHPIRAHAPGVGRAPAQMSALYVARPPILHACPSLRYLQRQDPNSGQAGHGGRRPAQRKPWTAGPVTLRTNCYSKMSGCRTTRKRRNRAVVGRSRTTR